MQSQKTSRHAIYPELGQKNLKDALKDLWAAVKNEDNTAAAAYLKELERVARQSAMAWVSVAAIAQKAEESL